MSEYIVRMPRDMPYELKAELNAWYVNSEPIVRCRDCKHFYEDRRNTSIGWVDVFVCESKQWSTSSLMPSHEVEPDGFCAWAERREP